jgi:1,2-diacylglycerol 3-beta-galactosyltransferase
MASPRRFLFLYSLTGGGHLAAARAVADAMHARFGDAAAVELVDVFVESGVWPFKHFPDWYPTMLGLGGWPWRLAYHATDSRLAVSALSRLLWPTVAKQVARLLNAHPHDAIVSFHPIPNGILARHRMLHEPHMPLAVAAQDFTTAPAAWFAPGLDAYFLPWPETQARALALGLPEDRLHVTGMPVRRAFLDAQAMPREDARKSLGMAEDAPMILFIGGGDGAGDMAPFVEALMARQPVAQVVVITGRNEALRRRLQARCPAPNLHVLGFQERMPLWMRAADILVTKAGPNTLAEAFLMGLPAVMYHAIPGQEAGNPGFVAQHGAGIWAPHPGRAADAVMRLLADAGARSSMAEAARALARPHAADAIARALWELAE